VTLGLQPSEEGKNDKDRQKIQEDSLFRITSATVDSDERIKVNAVIKIQHVASGLHLSTKVDKIFDASDDKNNFDETGGRSPSKPKVGDRFASLHKTGTKIKL
jgi:hypothetical protein